MMDNLKILSADSQAMPHYRHGPGFPEGVSDIAADADRGCVTCGPDSEIKVRINAVDK